MSKSFISILFVLALFPTVFYQFSFAEKNHIAAAICKDTVSIFCQINSCGNCEDANIKNSSTLGCNLMLDANNYFSRGGSCSFTEKSQCEWKRTWKTDFCEQVRAVDKDVKVKLGINKRNFGSFDVSTQTKKTYFGNEAKGDFNGDGKQDIAYLFTEDGGGSGTFYYVTVKLAGGKELNAILLGDRIAPQITEFRKGKIIVNYADRKPDEPMTTKPSVGVSKYFKVVNNQLVEVK